MQQTLVVTTLVLAVEETFEYQEEAGCPYPSKLLGQQRCMWPLFLVTASYSGVHPENRRVSDDPAA